MLLTKEQKDQFDRDGYLVIPDFFDPTKMRSQASQLLSDFDISNHPLTKFTTGENQTSDEYFLTSGDKIRYFFEEGALSNDNVLLTDKEKAINKIGHALHELDPVFKEFSTSEKVVDVARSLNYKDARVLQSMLIFKVLIVTINFLGIQSIILIFKQPDIGGEVTAHVDSTFLYTNPTSATGLWFALEDCTLENGCMWFVPGSHKKVPLLKRFIRNKTNDGTLNVKMNEGQEPDDSEYIAAPVTSGSLVLIHGLVYHKSGANHSKKSRWIYTFHMIDGSLEYPADNWLLPTPEMPFTKLF
ncbi:hypothetical protein BC833DRAFT_47563 [Globomyces pollinis-pini]|nr:hypothetical protein BC833DRAFT_47563 [Globomyces pollinis-pini]